MYKSAQMLMTKVYHFMAMLGLGMASILLICQSAYAVSCPSINPCQINDPAKYACFAVTNNSSHRATMYIDGNYACDADPDTICTAVVAIGVHYIEEKSDVPTSTGTSTVTIPAGGVCWNLFNTKIRQ